MNRSDRQKCLKACGNALPSHHQATILLLELGECPLGLEPRHTLFDRSATVLLGLPDPLRERCPDTPLPKLLPERLRLLAFIRRDHFETLARATAFAHVHLDRIEQRPHLRLVIDHPVGRVPDTPPSHLTLTVRTAQRISPRAVFLPLPGGQPGDARHRALDHALHLGQGRLHAPLHLGKRLGGLHPIIPDAFEPCGHRVLHHPADTRGDSDGFVLHLVGAVRPGMGRDPLAIVAIDAPDGARRADHVWRHGAGHTLRL